MCRRAARRRPGLGRARRCLERQELPDAAARAWRHAWEADPALADRALVAALDFAHRWGDDALVVDVAATMPTVDDPDAAGHLSLARALAGAGEEGALLEAIAPDACRYPLARYRLAGRAAAEDRRKTQVLLLRSVVDWSGDHDLAGWGRGPTWELWSLGDLALLNVASVYAALDRPDPAREVASALVRGADPATSYGRTMVAWADLRSGATDEARRGAHRAESALPEASAVAVAASPDRDARVRAARRAHERWGEVRGELSAFVASPGAGPEALERLGVGADAVRSAGGMGPLGTMWLRAFELDREARHTRRDPVGAALVAEARDALDEAFSTALVRVATSGIERIDRALLAVDGAVEGQVVPPTWRAEDLGWFLP